MVHDPEGFFMRDRHGAGHVDEDHQTEVIPSCHVTLDSVTARVKRRALLSALADERKYMVLLLLLSQRPQEGVRASRLPTLSGWP